jgi:uncharacterized membrane protein
VSPAAAAVLLVVGTGVSWALLDLQRKLLSHRVDATPQALFLAAGQLPLLAAWAFSTGFTPRFSVAYLVPALLSAALNVASILGFITALRISPFSVTVPLLSLTPLFITLVAMPILGEAPSARQWIGIVMVVVGALGLNLELRSGATVGSVVRAFAGERGALLMAGVAVCWSLTLPLDKLAMERSSPQQHAFVLTALVAAGMLGLLLVRGRVGGVVQFARTPWLMSSAIATNAVALVLQLLAMERVLVGLLETFKRGIGSVLALVFGALLFRERITAPKVAAVALMAIGVALLLL